MVAFELEYFLDLKKNLIFFFLQILTIFFESVVTTISEFWILRHSCILMSNKEVLKIFLYFYF